MAAMRGEARCMKQRPGAMIQLHPAGTCLPPRASALHVSISDICPATQASPRLLDLDRVVIAALTYEVAWGLIICNFCCCSGFVYDDKQHCYGILGKHGTTSNVVASSDHFPKFTGSVGARNLNHKGTREALPLIPSD